MQGRLVITVVFFVSLFSNFYFLRLSNAAEGQEYNAIFSEVKQRQIEYHQKEIQNNPNNSQLYLSFGRLYQSYDMFPEALKFFHAALELNSQNPQVYYSIGETYEKLKQFKEAKENYLKAQELAHDRILLFQLEEKMRVLPYEGGQNVQVIIGILSAVTFIICPIWCFVANFQKLSPLWRRWGVILIIMTMVSLVIIFCSVYRRGDGIMSSVGKFGLQLYEALIETLWHYYP